MSSYSRNDVYFNHFITQQKCGYTAPALVRLLRANVTDLYINMVDEFNKVDINHLIDELKKEFQNAVEKKCFVVTVDSYNFFRSNEPPSEFCIQNETTDEELRLIQNFETPIAPQIVALLGPQYVASCLGFDLVRQPRGQTFNRINNKCHVPLSMLHW
ncbi:hypothetical protein DdX_18203 [Ditylenchus destructor]|uniref:Uncharacterized protein n=1 Tax=Ditylenchus destructor TaxID=166010 RepID=A0AAD4QYD2_9BILA|nr:hypothetical protein DdX_18203 [Ditylenchus destructor]